MTGFGMDRYRSSGGPTMGRGRYFDVPNAEIDTRARIKTLGVLVWLGPGREGDHKQPL
jgi:hypothetical protein